MPILELLDGAAEVLQSDWHPDTIAQDLRLRISIL